MNLGEKVKDLRLNKQQSQSEFASAIGLTQSWLNKIENGKVEVTKKVIASIKRVYGFSIDEQEKNPFGTMKMAEERALIRVMLDELTVLKSKAQGVSYEEAKDELRRKTNLILDAMRDA